jgi:hypothetical protein
LRVKARLDEPELYKRLFDRPYEEWRWVINRYYEDDPSRQVTLEPIPDAVAHVLINGDLDLSKLREALGALPARWSDNMEDRVHVARIALTEGLRTLWPQVLRLAKFRSPLLVLDEAHHLKNPETRLASLFSTESDDTPDMLAGAFNGRFERMLFLTATPFQLGHNELVEVLMRFQAVIWKDELKGELIRYQATIEQLRTALDQAQQVAQDFDKKWRYLPRHLGPEQFDDVAVDTWWTRIRAAMGEDSQVSSLAEINRAYDATARAMAEAQRLLKPWVIRHRRRLEHPASIATDWSKHHALARSGTGWLAGQRRAVAAVPSRRSCPISCRPSFVEDPGSVFCVCRWPGFKL